MTALLVGFNGESRDRLPTGTEHRGLCGDKGYEDKKQHQHPGVIPLPGASGENTPCVKEESAIDFYAAYSERAPIEPRGVADQPEPPLSPDRPRDRRRPAPDHSSDEAIAIRISRLSSALPGPAKS